jgi:hypothetical protein
MTALRCPSCGDTRFRRYTYFVGLRTDDFTFDPDSGVASAESSADVSIDKIYSLIWACVANEHEVSDPDLIDELDRKTKHLTEARSS